MAADAEKSFRPWVAWLIGCVWVGTAVAVLIAVRIHPATITNISVNTRKLSFRTDATHILGPGNHEQLLVSGMKSLQVRFSIEQTIHVDGVPAHVASLSAEGDSFSSCSFYRVRSGGLEVLGPSVVTLQFVEGKRGKSFSMKSHGMLKDELSSLHSEPGRPSAFECRGLRVDGKTARNIDGTFYPEGGDTVFVASAPDTRIDFTLSEHSDVSDMQIPILGEVRFTETDPGSSEEKSVLLAPPAEITFEKANKVVTLKFGDLLVVVPQKDFYVRQFMVTDGIHLSLHGKVRDVRAGAGVKDMASLMPSAFDQSGSAARILGAIATLSGVMLGILEKMGLLGKK
jgi:hypothetical protein